MTRNVICGVLLYALLVEGCTSASRTDLVVWMDTDYEVPAECAQVRARVHRVERTNGSADEVLQWDHTFALAAAGSEDKTRFELPASFAVVPEDVTTTVVVELSALSANDDLLVQRRSRTRFLQGRSLLLPMFLHRACANVLCPEGQTCGCVGGRECATPTCIDEFVPPEDLEPPGDGGISFIPDTGILPADAGGDTSSDASSDSGGRMDADVADADVVVDAGVDGAADADVVVDAGVDGAADAALDGGPDCRQSGCEGFTYCDLESGLCLEGCDRDEQCPNDERCVAASCVPRPDGMHRVLEEAASSVYLALDDHGDPLIVYGKSGEIWFATLDGTEWNTQDIGARGSSIDFAASGDRAFVSYVEGNRVRAAVRELDGGWALETVAVSPAALLRTSVAIGAAGQAAVAYSREFGDNESRLHFASRVGADAWTTDSGFNPDSSDMSLTFNGNTPSIAHAGQLTPLRFSERVGGFWRSENIDVGLLIFNVGIVPSLRFDAAGVAHVIYGHGLDQVVKYSRRFPNGDWPKEAVGAFLGGLIFTNTPQLAVAGTGSIYATYHSNDNGLIVGRRSEEGDWAWRVVDAADISFQEPAIAVDSSGDVHLAYVGVNAFINYTTLAPW